MNFLAPLILFGATLAAIPVILHFFFRSRYRTVPWAAMTFLFASIEQTSRRLKFQELLLLLARMLIIALLAIALARLLAPSIVYVVPATLFHLLPIIITFLLVVFIVLLAERYLNASRLMTFLVLVFLTAFLCVGVVAADSLLLRFLPRQGSLSFGGGGRGEAVDAVFVFDVSYSMAAREGDESRLDKAKTSALEIINQLPLYSGVQIITCSDQAELIGPRVPANLDQARYLIKDIKTTDLATDYLAGAQEALKVLKRQQLSNKEVYIFSDMQKSGWEAQSSAVAETMREIHQRATVYLVRCGTRTPTNVALVGITPQSGIPRPGERVGFAVLVKNTGSREARDLEVSLMLDGEAQEKETRSIKSLPPGETKAVTLSAKMSDKGLHIVTAKVKSDDLPSDNRFDRVILVRDAVRVLVIDGAVNKEDAKKSSTFYLAHALVPVADAQKRDYHIHPELITPRQAVPGMLAKFDLCILSNVSVTPDLSRRVQHLSPEFLDDLNRWVREGHGLMIFPGEHIKVADYNKQFVDQRKLLPYPLTRVEHRANGDALKFNRDTARLPVYRRLREDKAFELFNEIMTWQAFEMNEPAFQASKKSKADNKATPKRVKSATSTDSVIVALRYNNKRAAIVAHRVDAGDVLFFTTAAYPGEIEGSVDPTWTDLPLFPFFPLLVDLSLNHLLHQQTQNHNASAGQTLTWFAPRKEADRTFALYRPDGKKKMLGQPESQGDRPLITLDDLPIAGVYQLASIDRSKKNGGIVNDPLLVEQIRQGKLTLGRPFAVTPNLSESADLSAMTNEQIDDLLKIPVIHANANSSPASYSGLDRGSREWTWWVLLAVLCVTFGEGVLAWFCGRPI